MESLARLIKQIKLFNFFFCKTWTQPLEMLCVAADKKFLLKTVLALLLPEEHFW